MSDVRTKFKFSETKVYPSEHGDHFLITREYITNSTIYERTKHYIEIYRNGVKIKNTKWRDFLLVSYGVHRQKIDLPSEFKYNPYKEGK